MSVVTQALRWVRGPSGPHPLGKFIALIDTDKRVSVYAGNVEYHAHLPVGAEIHDEHLREKLYAAGTFSQDGTVLSWVSTGYDFETPSSRRTDIERFFLGQRKAIAQCWMR